MSRRHWELLRQTKFFYVYTYRRAVFALFVSLSVNVLLLLAFGYAYIMEPKRTFYATSGIVPPVKLTALSERNYSAEPLLKTEPSKAQKVSP